MSYLNVVRFEYVAACLLLGATAACSSSTGITPGETGAGGANSAVGTGGSVLGSGGLNSGAGEFAAGTGGLNTGGGGFGSGGQSTSGSSAGDGGIMVEVGDAQVTGGDEGTGGADFESGEVLDPANLATLLIAEDFEDGSEGQQPADWGNFINWVQDQSNPSGDTQALVTKEFAYTGEQSVHFHGGQNPAQLWKPLPDGTNILYVRMFVRMSRQFGENPGANHETLIAIRDNPNSADSEVRFGEIKGVIGTNEIPSDDISPQFDQWGLGPSIPANTWACVEVGFLGDRQPNELHAWVDGEEVHTITDPVGDFQHGSLTDDWLAKHFGNVVIGWHSFSNETIDLWVDDLVVAQERIGCGTSAL